MDRDFCYECKAPMFLSQIQGSRCDQCLYGQEMVECFYCRYNSPLGDVKHCSYCCEDVCPDCWDDHWMEDDHMNWDDDDD